ncbi:uncharacterized protein METZ01_LOCUS436245, partial [marine metagenome]
MQSTLRSLAVFLFVLGGFLFQSTA